MTPNEAIIRAFADQFTPPLNVCKTECVNNLPVQDAWTASCWDDTHSIGITTVAYGNGIHAFIEAAGPAHIAEHAGRVMAKALGLFQEMTDEDQS